MKQADRDELLIRLDERVETIHEDIGGINKRFDNHSKRLGSLETWKNRGIGVITLLGLIIGGIVAIVSAAMGK